MQELTEEQYRVLFAFRCALRQYLQWSANHAATFGLAPQQAQLLLAIRVRPAETPLSISDLAEALQIRQHSAVGLANRAQRAGLVTRSVDPDDQRVVRIGLTPQGRTLIAQLAESHLAELQLVAGALQISDEFLENLSRQFASLLPGLPDEASEPASRWRPGRREPTAPEEVDAPQAGRLGGRRPPTVRAKPATG
jgi:DNA-binding MarR family transcriptional regulator